jgi:hypothetical protein
LGRLPEGFDQGTGVLLCFDPVSMLTCVLLWDKGGQSSNLVFGYG